MIFGIKMQSKKYLKKLRRLRMKTKPSNAIERMSEKAIKSLRGKS